MPKGSKTKAYNQAIQAYLEKKKISFVSPTSDTTIIGATPTSKDITGYFVEEIYTNSKQKELWKKLVLDKKIQISIDCWSFGLIFTKKDQEKEHFVLFKNSWR